MSLIATQQVAIMEQENLKDLLLQNSALKKDLETKMILASEACALINQFIRSKPDPLRYWLPNPFIDMNVEQVVKLNDLPEEIIVHIARFLGPRDRATLRLVSGFFRACSPLGTLCSCQIVQAIWKYLRRFTNSKDFYVAPKLPNSLLLSYAVRKCRIPSNEVRNICIFLNLNSWKVVRNFGILTTTGIYFRNSHCNYGRWYLSYLQLKDTPLYTLKESIYVGGGVWIDLSSSAVKASKLCKVLSKIQKMVRRAELEGLGFNNTAVVNNVPLQTFGKERLRKILHSCLPCPGLPCPGLLCPGLACPGLL